MFYLCFLGFISGIWQEIVGALFILAMGWLWVKFWASEDFRKRQFKDRVVLSINTLDKQDEKYKLSLRTIFEKDVKDVFQNERMTGIIKTAIKDVTEEEPILPLSEEHSWFILNTILNQISEQFATGILQRDMGAKVTSKWYTFCLTFEKEGGVKMQKLRVMLIQKNVLESFPEDHEILLESERHSTRVNTLKYMKKTIKDKPYLFMNMELYQTI